MRTKEKGHHATWWQRSETHLELYESGAWLKEHPCDSQCAFAQQCLKRLTAIDVRDCAIHVFGHANAGNRPSVLHAEATQKWFSIVLDSRIVQPCTPLVSQFSFRLLHASGVQVCSGACCFLYGCATTTWSSMVDAAKQVWDLYAQGSGASPGAQTRFRIIILMGSRWDLLDKASRKAATFFFKWAKFKVQI